MDRPVPRTTNMCWCNQGRGSVSTVALLLLNRSADFENDNIFYFLQNKLPSQGGNVYWAFPGITICVCQLLKGALYVVVKHFNDATAHTAPLLKVAKT
jgi:hypothetical protein